MRRLIYLTVLAAGLAPTAVHAQYYQKSPVSPYGRPALSPYLDIVRGGNPAINYYLGTLPEIDRRYNAQQQYSQLPASQPQSIPMDQEDFVPALPQTGHATGFQAYGGYYNFQHPPRTFFPNPSTRKR